jgi:hypothetical protein
MRKKWRSSLRDSNRNPEGTQEQRPFASKLSDVMLKVLDGSRNSNIHLVRQVRSLGHAHSTTRPKMEPGDEGPRWWELVGEKETHKGGSLDGGYWGSDTIGLRRTSSKVEKFS